jgi:hypothetical protein
VALHGDEEFMPGEGVVGVDKGVPFPGGDLFEATENLEFHESRGSDEEQQL